MRVQGTSVRRRRSPFFQRPQPLFELACGDRSDQRARQAGHRLGDPGLQLALVDLAEGLL
jgi:hypothetical protein